MARRIVIEEQNGIYTLRTATNEFQSTRLENVIERADPGVPHPNVDHAAGVLERILGPKQNTTGSIRQGLVGT